MFICLDASMCAGTGDTLEKAYEDYKNQHSDDPIEECTFYEADLIEVETRIIKVKTIQKRNG